VTPQDGITALFYNCSESLVTRFSALIRRLTDWIAMRLRALDSVVMARIGVTVPWPSLGVYKWRDGKVREIGWY
jgi:hypothetical protein